MEPPHDGEQLLGKSTIPSTIGDVTQQTPTIQRSDVAHTEGNPTPMSKNKKCPCKSNKRHLGIHSIEPKQAKVSPTLSKVQKRFFIGHGIVTREPKEAARLFLSRDHEKIEALLVHYYNGKLGVYMVPPMFFGEVPEAVILAGYKDPKHLDRVRGDIAENKVYHALNDYFKRTGYDVLIVHSHKFLNQTSNNEKDFIVFNLSKGKLFVVTCKILS